MPKSWPITLVLVYSNFGIHIVDCEFTHHKNKVNEGEINEHWSPTKPFVYLFVLKYKMESVKVVMYEY